MLDKILSFPITLKQNIVDFFLQPKQKTLRVNSLVVTKFEDTFLDIQEETIRLDEIWISLLKNLSLNIKNNSKENEQTFNLILKTTLKYIETNITINRCLFCSFHMCFNAIKAFRNMIDKEKIEEIGLLNTYEVNIFQTIETFFKHDTNKIASTILENNKDLLIIVDADDVIVDILNQLYAEIYNTDLQIFKKDIQTLLLSHMRNIRIMLNVFLRNNIKLKNGNRYINHLKRFVLFLS